MKEVKNNKTDKATSKTDKATGKTATKTTGKTSGKTDTKAEATPEPVSWDEQKKRLKSKFSMLTDADLNFAESKKEEMMKKLQTKLGKTKEELAKIVAAL